MKKVIALGIIAGLMAVVTPVSAKPDASATVVHSVRTPHVTVPSHAVELAPGVFSLGAEVDSAGRVVEGIAFVHYKKGYGHKPQHNPGGGNGGGKNGDDTASTCYVFLANGAKWKEAKSYAVDASNNAGLAGGVIRSLMADATEVWDSEVLFDIFGAGSAATVNAGSIGNSTNGNNEVIFADIDGNGVIAVTYVWGIWWGKPSGREIVEWDMVFDDADFDWGTDGSSGVMDFLNIAVHEVGHAAGLGHPSDSCTEESMYRFGASGETKKRTLNIGDITGITKLYN